MTRTIGLLLALAAWLGVTAPPGQAAAMTPEQRAEIIQVMRDALRQDPSILRDAFAALQADDQTVRQNAAAAAIAANGPALARDPADQVGGNPAGSVSVVEFYDPRCPYCRQMLPVIAGLVRADPNVRVVYKDIPILGPASVLESRALLAAQAQGGYLRLQEAVMRRTGTPTAADLRADAVREGLDGSAFDRALADPAIDARLQRNLRLAASLHIDGTPALIVGNQMISGAVDLPELQRAVAAARR